MRFLSAIECVCVFLSVVVFLRLCVRLCTGRMLCQSACVCCVQACLVDCLLVCEWLRECTFVFLVGWRGCVIVCVYLYVLVCVKFLGDVLVCDCVWCV